METNDKIVIYQTEDGQTQIDVRLENDTVWLNVAQMGALFTREFYKYVAPRKSEEIFAHLQELEQQESALMAKIMGR